MDLAMLKFFIALHSLIEAIMDVMMDHLQITVGQRTKLIIRKHNLDEALDAWRVNPDGTAEK